jgi:hypothetical protein
MGAFLEDRIDGRSNAKIVLDNVHRNIYLDPVRILLWFCKIALQLL